MSKSASMKAGGTAKAAKRSSATWSTGTKVMIGAGAFVLLVGGLVVVAKPDPAAKATATVAAAQPDGPAVAGQLTALRTKYNFGEISMARGKVTYRYPISNSGTETISIRKLYTSCMCTTAALVKDGKTSEAYGMPGHGRIPEIDIPIGPTDRAFIEVVFDPAAHGPSGVGPIERVVTVENSAGAPLELQFAALVKP